MADKLRENWKKLRSCNRDRRWEKHIPRIESLLSFMNCRNQIFYASTKKQRTTSKNNTNHAPLVYPAIINTAWIKSTPGSGTLLMILVLTELLIADELHFEKDLENVGVANNFLWNIGQARRAKCLKLIYTSINLITFQPILLYI